MSTCRGTWRDANVPGEVGVLASANGAFFVFHAATTLCPTDEPHHADVCGEFLPVRPGYEPDADRPTKATRWLYDWDAAFAALESGQSIFAVLERATAAADVANAAREGHR